MVLNGDQKNTKHKTLLLEVSKEFCQSTSLHGYSYIVNGNSLFVKIIWLMVITCLTGIGIRFLIVNTEEYWNSRLVTSIDDEASLEVSELMHTIWVQDLPSPKNSPLPKTNRIISKECR